MTVPGFELVKVGGSCLASHFERVVLALTRWRAARPDLPLLVVHGYSRRLTELLATLGLERPTFRSASGVESHRTGEAALAVSLLAAVLVRDELVAALRQSGLATASCPGPALLAGRRRDRLRWRDAEGILRLIRDDRSGTPTAVRWQALSPLLEGHGAVVISPVLADEAEPGLLVADADAVAAEIARQAGLERFTILSDQAFHHSGAVVSEIAGAELAACETDARGGMGKKLRAIARALDGGVRAVRLVGLTGAGDHPEETLFHAP